MVPPRRRAKGGFRGLRRRCGAEATSGGGFGLVKTGEPFAGSLLLIRSIPFPRERWMPDLET